MKPIAPTISSWYQDREQHTWFEVVALDDKAGTIEVQYFDGAIAEFDRETWRQLSLVSAAAPEDSDAAYELSLEDRGNDEDLIPPLNQINFLAMLEPESFPGIEDF